MLRKIPFALVAIVGLTWANFAQGDQIYDAYCGASAEAWCPGQTFDFGGPGELTEGLIRGHCGTKAKSGPPRNIKCSSPNTVVKCVKSNDDKGSCVCNQHEEYLGKYKGKIQIQC